MSGERQFLLYGEDADTGPSLAFDRGITGQDKCSFRQIHFASDSLHFYIVQTAAVGEDGKRIALERAGSEYIKLDEGKTARRRRHADWIHERIERSSKVFIGAAAFGCPANTPRLLLTACRAVRLTTLLALRILIPCECPQCRAAVVVVRRPVGS